MDTDPIRRRLADRAGGETVLWPTILPLRRRVDPERAPLTLAQERTFLRALRTPGIPLHEALAVHFEGELEAPRLALALDALQRRHELLRSTFALAFAGAEQRVEPEPRVPLRTLDLRDEPRAPRHARALAEADARAAFDLAAEPPWRAALFRVASRRWLLALCLHRLVAEPATMDRLLEDLAAFYAGRRLVPLAVQYGDVAAWERARRAGTRDQAVRPRAHAPALHELAWTESHGAASGRGARVPLLFPADAHARVAAFARDHGAASGDVLLAAWLALLGAEAATEHVHTAVLRRRPRELGALLGDLRRTLVVRAELGAATDAHELVARARAALRAHGAPEPGADGLSPASFSFRRRALHVPVFRGLLARCEPLDAGGAGSELALDVHLDTAGLAGHLEVDLGRFPRATAERIGTAYVALVEALLARPGARLTELCSPARVV